MLPILIPRIRVQLFMKIDRMFFTLEKCQKFGGYAPTIKWSQKN